jgi:hypothetical protein
MRFFLAVFVLWSCLVSPLSAWAQDAGAEKNDPIPNLLEQLDIEAAKPKKPSPVLSAPKGSLLDQDKRQLPYKSYSEIPEEAIVEAEAFQQACEADSTLSTYYECECWAMRFLEQRIIRGPEVDATAVMLDIQADCPNTPAIAGMAYNTCIGQGVDFFPDKHDPEEYCSCVGNAYAKLYARSGRSIDTRLMVQLRTIASLSCTQQEPGVPVLVPPIK